MPGLTNAADSPNTPGKSVHGGLGDTGVDKPRAGQSVGGKPRGLPRRAGRVGRYEYTPLSILFIPTQRARAVAAFSRKRHAHRVLCDQVRSLDSTSPERRFPEPTTRAGTGSVRIVACLPPMYGCC